LGAFGAVAVNIFSVVVMPLDGIPEEFTSGLDFFTNLRKIRQFKRRTILSNQIVNIDIIKEESVILEIKSVLRKVKGLSDKVVVCVLHFPVRQRTLWQINQNLFLPS